MSAENGTKFSVQFSSKLGRYLRSEQDLDAHEVIIDEVPLLVAPSGHHEWHSETHRPLFICIGCLRSQDEEVKFEKCGGCSWPVCSEGCVGIGKFHTEEECRIFKARGIIQSPRTLKMIYILRCWLLQGQESEKWTKLQDLAASPEVKAMEEADESETGEAHPAGNINKNKELEFLVEFCGLESVDPQLVSRLSGVRRVNGFSFYNTETDEVRYYGMALYYETSMASHGCTPNLTTQVVYDPRESFPMRLRTKTKVREGETLQIAYRDRWLVLGTLRRREKIFSDHKFQCQCSRCGDPSEGGTFFSAVACSSCPPNQQDSPPATAASYLLPIDPLDSESEWKCGTCDQRLEESQISAIIEEVTQETERILEGSETSDEDKFQLLTEYLSPPLTRRLHPNHYLLLRLELEWIRHFQWEHFESKQDEEDFDDGAHQQRWQLFLLLIERAEHCKSVYERLIPDWADKNNFVDVAIGRAYFLYYLQQERLSSLQNDLVLDLIKLSLTYLQRGARHESPCSEAAKLCFVMVTAIGNVKRLIRSQSCDKGARAPVEITINPCD